MKPISVRDWGKGLNLDQPPFELATGFWSNGQNVRFRAGKAERVGGIASVITPSVTPYWLFSYSSGPTRYLVYANASKAYSHDGSTETEITRLAGSGVIVTALTRSSVTGVVTVTTEEAHGLINGNYATMYGLPAGAGADANGQFAVTVTSSTIFTYTTSLGTNYTATASELEAIGYTSTSGAVLNFTGAVDDKITGGNSNGVLVYNNPVNGLFYWNQVLGSYLVRMTGFGSRKADVARPFKNFIVCLAPTISGTKYRHTVLWSSEAEPGAVPSEFTASDTNSAGQVDVVSDGELVDCREWGEDLILYKRDVRFRMQYIGGNSIFSFQLISGNSRDDGLLAANCICNTPKGQVFLTDGHDIRIHSGGESTSIATGRVLNYLRANINATHRKRAFLAANPLTNEVWVCYPETGQTTCSKALVWNWDEDTWGGIRDLTNVVSGASGSLPSTIATTARLLIGNTTPRIGLTESGTTDFGAAFTTMLERAGMDFDDTGYKTLHQSMPRFDASTNFTATIQHGASATQDGTTTYSTSQTYTHNTTDRVHSFSPAGRYLAWKMTTTASDTPVLRSIDFWINSVGEW